MVKHLEDKGARKSQNLCMEVKQGYSANQKQQVQEEAGSRWNL